MRISDWSSDVCSSDLCVQGAAFFGFMDVLFKNQEKWASSNDPLAAVGQYAALAGLDKPTYEKCVSDEAAIDRILAKQVDGRDRYRVPSTPTFVVHRPPEIGTATCRGRVCPYG